MVVYLSEIRMLYGLINGRVELHSVLECFSGESKYFSWNIGKAKYWVYYLFISCSDDCYYKSNIPNTENVLKILKLLNFYNHIFLPQFESFSSAIKKTFFMKPHWNLL